MWEVTIALHCIALPGHHGSDQVHLYDERAGVVGRVEQPVRRRGLMLLSDQIQYM